VTTLQDDLKFFNRADAFWEWFASQSEALADLLEQGHTPTSVHPHPLWADLTARLATVHPDLRITVIHDPKGPVVLLSAVGGLANITLVVRCNAVVPPIPRWEIAPFRQIFDPSRRFLYTADDLPIEDIGLTVTATAAGLRLVVYAADDLEADPEVLRRLNFILNVMYDPEVIAQFAEVLWRQAPPAFREEEQIYPFNELLEVLGGRTARAERWSAQETLLAS
jgi:hypothetical protein